MGSRTIEPRTKPRAPRNAEIADRLDDVADLLEAQRANQYRVHAWRGGAANIRSHSRSVAEVARDEGLEGLDRIPGIGPALARAVVEIAETGRLGTLDRLRGESDPLALLTSVPGIGGTLARRIHDDLRVESLEQLEVAAHDGSLESVPGMGAKRLSGIRDALATRLRHRRLEAGPPPPVGELLAVDRDYLERSKAGTLPKIAPRRFNPAKEAWLPVLHSTFGARHYTALFSNTATAHRLGRTHDWVVIYADGHDGNLQHTVVTQPGGPLAGRRVVRGREGECAEYYAAHGDSQGDRT